MFSRTQDIPGSMSRGNKGGIMKRRMNRMGSLAGLILMASMVLMLSAIGCSSEPDEVLMTPQQVGERGESCTARNDCKEGLACVRGTCVRNDYAINPSSGECVLLECEGDNDCCQGPAECPEWKEACDQDSSSPDCQNLEFYCDCDYQCADSQCRPGAACEQDDDCGVDGICQDGDCVQCVDDDDCPGDDRCISGFCGEGCAVDSNCPLFHTCNDGDCVEQGCQTDRECVHFAQDGDAVCTDGECVVPCTNDAECNGGQNGFFEICDGGKCVFIGCETDEECRVALDLEETSGNTRTVCEN
ncbi:MAG: hypothetical protein ACLFVJ_20785 [Persicimonas sp.]